MSETRSLRQLGIRLSRDQMSLEVSERIRCARRWVQRHWQVLCDPRLRRSAKFQIYKSFVRPILTYGCEVWTLDDRSKMRLRRFESSVLLEIYKSKYPHRHPKRLRPNLVKVSARFKDKDIIDYVTYDRSTWDDLLRVENVALKERNVKRKCVHWWDRSRNRDRLVLGTTKSYIEVHELK